MAYEEGMPIPHDRELKGMVEASGEGLELYRLIKPTYGLL